MYRDESHAATDTASAPHTRDSAPGGVVQQLRIVFRAMQEHSRWVERQCGVSAAQLWAMWELYRAPGAQVSALSQALSLHRSTTSNLLEKLERKGLIERRRGGPDQRVVRVYLTTAGKSLVEDAPQPAQGAISAALENMPATDVELLEQALSQLVSAMCIKGNDAALRHMSEGE